MTREIVVRSYCTGDVEDIKEILSECPSPTGQVWSEDMIEKMLSDALREQPDGVFVATRYKQVVGFTIVMYRAWLNIAYLDYIQVKRNQIRKGIGHRLIEKCVNWAKGKHARIIFTETGQNNKRAIKFYQRHGFQITGYIPDYYQKGLDAVILVRKLK
ncbi:MAG: GNAT family N-acetyltransferase [Candidatus Hodarchaeota archaeon]